LLLAGNAKIFQQGSVISSDKINYNIAAESVAASSSDSESSRVKMVLEPGGAEIPKNSYEKELGTKPDQNITNPAAEEQ
jgi:lipopolysaccharide export system protein LptA